MLLINRLADGCRSPVTDASCGCTMQAHSIRLPSPARGTREHISWCLIPTHGPVKKLINPRDSDERNARRLDTWEVLPVLRQIGSLRSLLRRNALLLEAADLAPHIAKVRLKVIDLGSVRESVAVTGKNGYEIELLQLLQGFAPLIHKCIAHVRKRRRQHVSRTNNLLFWKVHNDIAGSMGTTEKTNLSDAFEHE